MKRRDFLRSVAATGISFTAGGVAGGFLATAGEKSFNTLFEKENLEDVQKSTLDFLFGALYNPPSIYAGKGNAIGLTLGLESVSEYLRFASSRFSSYVATAMGIKFNTVTDNGGAEFLYNENSSALFLGSAAANEITSKLLGYSDVEVIINNRSVFLPKPNPDHRLTRWSFLYGDTGFGIYAGKNERALRYSKTTGTIAERPIYKLLDKDSKKVFAPALTNGFLANEWITIQRIEERGTYKVVIAGMHGYSIEAFCRNLTASIKNLERVAGSLKQYQVVAPVMLKHEKNAIHVFSTEGEIDWAKAQLHKVRHGG